MARRPKGIASTDVQSHVEQVKGLLDNFVLKLEAEDLREKVLALIPVFHALRDLGSGLIPRSIARSARDRIIAYLRRYPFVPIDGEELMVVSGIIDWPRRVRELRVEFGWSIYSEETLKQMVLDLPDEAIAMQAVLHVDVADIPADHYVLMSEEQDKEAAFRWNVSNTIRNEGGSASARLLHLLRENLGKPVTGEELRYVARINEWPRRIRELRTEDGWPIFSNFQGRPDLPNGSYVLETEDRLAPHDRNIPDPVRVKVLERDVFRCVHCGWGIHVPVADHDPRKALELHHLIEHAAGGANTVENLITLCNVHHKEVHAGTLERVGTAWKERAKPPR